MTCPRCHTDHDTTACPLYQTYLYPTHPQPTMAPMTGWVCPNCKAGVSPYTDVCPVCPPLQVVTITTEGSK